MARKFLNGVDLASQKVVNLANGSASSDAAAFGQIPTSASTIGGLLASNNLSDVSSTSSAVSNLGLTNAQVAGNYTLRMIAV